MLLETPIVPHPADSRRLVFAKPIPSEFPIDSAVCSEFSFSSSAAPGSHNNVSHHTIQNRENGASRKSCAKLLRRGKSQHAQLRIGYLSSPPAQATAVHQGRGFESRRFGRFSGIDRPLPLAAFPCCDSDCSHGAICDECGDRAVPSLPETCTSTGSRHFP